jgi:hypothetical protein
VTESKYKDFLDILLTTVDSETGKGLDDLEILNEVDTFMVYSQLCHEQKKNTETTIQTHIFSFSFFVMI